MANIFDAGDIKAQIIREADNPHIRKKILPGALKMDRDDIIEKGNHLFEMTKMNGWLWVEAQVVKDVVDFSLGNNSLLTQDEIKGEVKIMQRVKALISMRDEFISDAKKKTEAEKEEKTEEGG